MSCHGRRRIFIDEHHLEEVQLVVKEVQGLSDKPIAIKEQLKKKRYWKRR